MSLHNDMSLIQSSPSAVDVATQFVTVSMDGLVYSESGINAHPSFGPFYEKTTRRGRMTISQLKELRSRLDVLPDTLSLSLRPDANAPFRDFTFSYGERRVASFSDVYSELVDLSRFVFDIASRLPVVSHADQPPFAIGSIPADSAKITRQLPQIEAVIQIRAGHQH